MQIQTNFLCLGRPAALGDQIDGWRVSWLGGWDRCRVFFIVMVAKEHATRITPHVLLKPGLCAQYRLARRLALLQ
jgi:hypothetical protein